MALEPGRLTRAAIHTEAGEAELRMSAAGNWQLAIRASEEREWRLACSGDLQAGASSLVTPSEHKRYRFGKLLVDTEARRAFVGEMLVGLSVKEFALLAALAREPTRVFTKQELMKEVWGYYAVHGTRTLESHASRLRVRLRRAGAVGFVINLHGVGYKLIEAPCPAAATGPR